MGSRTDAPRRADADGPRRWTSARSRFAGEVTGSYGGVITGLYLFRLGRMPYFGDGIYVGTTVETGNAWTRRPQDVGMNDLRRSYAVLFGADTILGPLYIAHGVTSGKKDSFYLYLGRSF